MRRGGYCCEGVPLCLIVLLTPATVTLSANPYRRTNAWTQDDFFEVVRTAFKSEECKPKCVEQVVVVNDFSSWLLGKDVADTHLAGINSYKVFRFKAFTLRDGKRRCAMTVKPFMTSTKALYFPPTDYEEVQKLSLIHI